MIALWDHKTDVTQSMAAKPDTHIAAKPGKEKQAQNLWRQRGRLFLPTRIFLPTVRALSVRLPNLALGSAWVPCHVNSSSGNSESWEKALCVYINSTIGILSVLGDRSNKKPTYPNISMDDMRKLTVPDFGKIGESAAVQLASTYDGLSNRSLLPLQEMQECDVRKALDDAVCTALGINTERVDTIRRHLTAEPSITGQRYDGRLG